MLYKRGDEKLPKSWRPIALTSSLYRIIFSHIAKCFQLINMEKSFINKNHKGFRFSVNGTAEHIASINELICNACRNNRDLQIVTIDFADDFGSISHKIITHSLKTIGFPSIFCNMIKYLYKDNKTFSER